MKCTSPQKRISALIKAKCREEGLGVRSAAAEAGISPATLSRLGRGISNDLPDTSTLTKLATWLGVSLNDLVAIDDAEPSKFGPQPTTAEIVEVHLRADKNLSPQTADALARMFKVMYDNATKPPTA